MKAPTYPYRENNTGALHPWGPITAWKPRQPEPLKRCAHCGLTEPREGEHVIDDDFRTFCDDICRLQFVDAERRRVAALESQG